MTTQTFTLTFGDVAENHARMVKHGTMAERGFNRDELITVKRWFQARGGETKLIKLHNYLPYDIDPEIRKNNKAWVLIIKNGVNIILEDENGATNMYDEQNALNKDKKALMYGRVVNKTARHNLCFGDNMIPANYEVGQGTVVAFDSVPITNRVRQTLGTILDSMRDLQLEGNYYYDINTCGIGWHSDLERTKVIGLRLGATFSLYFNWFHQNKPIGDKVKLVFNHGDMYMMSEKAVAPDGRKKNSYTLRHAAGADKYTKL
jgi:hypothetical protein